MCLQYSPLASDTCYSEHVTQIFNIRVINKLIIATAEGAAGCTAYLTFPWLPHKSHFFPQCSMLPPGHTQGELGGGRNRLWHWDNMERLHLLRDAIQKKTCRFKDICPIGFFPPPSSPIRTYLNWDIFKNCYPSPPLLQLGQCAFIILSANW